MTTSRLYASSDSLGSISQRLKTPRVRDNGSFDDMSRKGNLHNLTSNPLHCAGYVGKSPTYCVSFLLTWRFGSMLPFRHNKIVL